MEYIFGLRTPVSERLESIDINAITPASSDTRRSMTKPRTHWFTNDTAPKIGPHSDKLKASPPSRETKSAGGKRGLSVLRWSKTLLGMLSKRAATTGVDFDNLHSPSPEEHEELNRADAAKTQGLIERIPHLEIAGPFSLPPGDRAIVHVYLDTLPATDGEVSDPISVVAGSEVEVTLLTSSHFQIEGADAAKFVVRAEDPRTDAPEFQVTVKATDAWDGDSPATTAVFFVDGRPCGKVARSIVINGIPPNPEKKPDGKVSIVPNGGPPADLTVTVVANPANDGRQFWCTVTSPHLSKFQAGVRQRWNLQDVTQKLVRGYMDKFTAQNTKKSQLISELIGAGKLIYGASPKIFQEAFWALIDAGAPLQTIAIVSEEPFIPWELMIPTRRIDGRPVERDNPLGVDFQIGRWTDVKVIAPTRQIKLSDCYVVAPRYEGGMLLKHSADEAKLILTQYRGDLITPANFEEVP